MNADVVVIGGGPAGLAAAIAAQERGAGVCLVERERRLGGILKQCIHDGFGLLRYGEKLSGPEYAWREISALREQNIPALTETFVLAIRYEKGRFCLTLQNSGRGVFTFTAKALVAATGCRERTSRQVFIHGERPAGIFTAGTVQNLINIHGYLPGRRCVILGSGDIGLIMARRLVLEGACVEGVFELKPEPSGLMRNIVQCLHDFNIPLHLSTTVTCVHGKKRVEGVTVCDVGPDLLPLAGSERFVPCDTLVVAVGLIPENEVLDPLGVEMDKKTGGPAVDQSLMASLPGLFSCGNSLHVNSLADHVSDSGTTAGQAAANFALGKAGERRLIPLAAYGEISYVVPQFLDKKSGGKVTAFFRSRRTVTGAELTVSSGNQVLLCKKYPVIRPPEAEHVVFDLANLAPGADAVGISLREEN